MVSFQTVARKTHLSLGVGLLGGLLLSSLAWSQTYQLTKLIQPKETTPSFLQRWQLQGDARAAADVLQLAGHHGFAGYSASLKTHKALGREGTAWVVWDTRTGKKLVALQNLKGDLRHSAFSANGMRLVTVGAQKNDTARVWNVASGTERFNLKEIWWAAFSPDGSRLATVNVIDHSVYIRDAATGRSLFTLNGHTDEVNRMAYSLDGQFIVTASYDDTARIWNANTGKQARVLQGHTSNVKRAVFGTSGALVVTGSDDHMARVWDVKSGKLLHVLSGHTDAIHDVIFDANSTHIATVSDDHTARVWDVKAGLLLATLRLDEPGTGVAFGSGGHLITRTAEETVQVWDVSTRTELMALQPVHKEDNVYIQRAVFSAEGSRLATLSNDGFAQIWDTSNGVQQLKLPEHMWNNVAFSLDGTRIATVRRGVTKAAQIWDVHGTQQQTLRGHQAYVLALAFSPDGAHVVTGSGDKTVRIWNANTGEQEHMLQGHDRDVSAVAFGPDGARVATGSDDWTARIWNAGTGTQVRVFKHKEPVLNVAFSPDGKRLITASMDHAVHIWDVATGKEHVLKGHRDDVNSVSFNKKGSQVVTTSDDHTVRVWDVTTGTEVYGFRPDSHAVTARFVGDKLQLVHEDFTLSLVTLSAQLKQLPGFAAFGQEMTQADVFKALLDTNLSLHCSRLPSMEHYISCEELNLGTGLQGSADFTFAAEKLQHVRVHVTQVGGEKFDTDPLRAAVKNQLGWLTTVDTMVMEDGAAATVEKVLQALASKDRVMLFGKKSPNLMGMVRKKGIGSDVRFFVQMTYKLPSSSVAAR